MKIRKDVTLEGIIFMVFIIVKIEYQPLDILLPQQGHKISPALRSDANTSPLTVVVTHLPMQSQGESNMLCHSYTRTKKDGQSKKYPSYTRNHIYESPDRGMRYKNRWGWDRRTAECYFATLTSTNMEGRREIRKYLGTCVMSDSAVVIFVHTRVVRA